MQNNTKIFDDSYDHPLIGSIQFRLLEYGDYSKGFVDVLNQLSSCTMTKEEFDVVFNKMVCYNAILT